MRRKRNNGQEYHNSSSFDFNGNLNTSSKIYPMTRCFANIRVHVQFDRQKMESSFSNKGADILSYKN